MQLADIQNAQKLIAPYIQKTPIVHVEGTNLFLKCEHLQVTNSFKARGAFYTLLSLNNEDKKRGVVTRSAGNFAKALAYAGQLLKIPVTIVMPLHAPEVKKEGVMRYGARIILHGTKHVESQAKVDEIARQEGLLALSPYDHRDVIIGQGTLGLEIKEQVPSIRNYIAPIGGGGLMGGSAFALKQLDPNIHIVGAEPAGAGDYFLSCQQGKKVVLEQTQSIADGLLAPTVGNLNWPLLQANVNRSILISEQEIIEAMRFLYTKLGMIAEPSAAVSVAAYLYHPELSLKGDSVSLISGGNVDLDKFYKWIC
jgi:threonine dehydratase